MSGQQLFATIKKASKYYTQNRFDAGRPVPFPVFINADWKFDKYVVIGGPGGRYWLSDVSLYVRGEVGEFLKVKA